MLTWFRLKSVETNLWQNGTSIMSQLCSDSSHASSLPHCKLPGFDTQAQVKNRIYIHTEKREEGQTDPGLAVWLYVWKMAEVAEFAIGFLFHASCACLWSQHWLRRKISTINGSLKIVQVVFLCFSLINWCFKMQLTWHSNHGTKKKYVTTESNKKDNKRYRLIMIDITFHMVQLQRVPASSRRTCPVGLDSASSGSRCVHHTLAESTQMYLGTVVSVVTPVKVAHRAFQKT